MKWHTHKALHTALSARTKSGSSLSVHQWGIVESTKSVEYNNTAVKRNEKELLRGCKVISKLLGKKGAEQRL